MDTALDLWDIGEHVTVDQARALARLTKLRKFKLVPARCLCAAANALAHLDLGATISGAGVASHELLGLGLRRSWRLTGLRIRAGAPVGPGEFRLLLGDSISATVITKLGCSISATPWQEREAGQEDEEEPLDLSCVSQLALLTHLELYGNVSGDLSALQNLTQLQDLNLSNTQVSGSLSFLQNLTQLQGLSLSNTQVSGSLSFLQSLTQLQHLDLNNTQVSGSVTSLPQLTDLAYLFVGGTQICVPTQEQLATFEQQHPNCRSFTHDH